MSWDIKNATGGAGAVPVNLDTTAPPTGAPEAPVEPSAADAMAEKRPPADLTGANGHQVGQGLPPALLQVMLANPAFANAYRSGLQLSGIAEPRPGLHQILIGLNAIADNALDPDIPLVEVARAGLESMAERAAVDLAAISDLLELPPTTDLAELARNLQRGMLALEDRSPAFAELSLEDRAEAFFAAFTQWDPWARTIRGGETTSFTELSHSSGIGMRFNESGAVRVLPLEEASPAYLAGLREGDRLTTVDGTLLDDSNGFELMIRVARAKPGDRVEVVVERDGETIPLTLVGAEWTPRSVITKTLADGSTLIRMYSFRPQSAAELRTVLEASESGQVILDLRSNAGGGRESARGIIDLFAAESKLSFQSRPGTYPSGAQSGDVGEEMQLVILLDERSASSSELVAGALAAQGRALLIGTRSFGKGVGQQPFALSDDLHLYFTASRALIDGVPYHDLGITPAMCIDEQGEDLDALMARAQNDEPLFPEEFAQQRVAAADDEAVRQEARQVCAPGNAPWLGGQSVELAQRLLADPQAFDNALAQQQRALANPNSADEAP